MAPVLAGLGYLAQEMGVLTELGNFFLGGDVLLQQLLSA